MKGKVFLCWVLFFGVFLSLNVCSQPAERLTKEKQLNLPEGVSSDWWATVSKQIKEEVYEIVERSSENGRKFNAFNRSQGLVSNFDKNGIVVLPSKEEEKKWELKMKLLPKKMEENGVRISNLKNKIEIERGNLSEWYINEENGLEQGFTVYKPLNEGILQKIDIEISGNLLPKISEDGQAITFYNKNNLNVLHYGNLIVKDSSGEILFSYFEGFAGGISIVFNAERAIYPITVDPVLTGPVWTGSGDTDNAEYGSSVSTAGDVNGDGYSDVIVGAPDHPGGGRRRGRAYLYLGSSSGL